MTWKLALGCFLIAMAGFGVAWASWHLWIDHLVWHQVLANAVKASQ